MRGQWVWRNVSVLGFCAALVAIGWPASSALAEDETKYIECTMTFDLEGWAFIVGKAHGDGSIECSNGQKADVSLEVKEVGFSFAKEQFHDATGYFTRLTSVEDVVGRYAGSGASAAAGNAAGAAGFLKNGAKVSLALIGTGKGEGLGRSWSELTIKKR